MPEKPLKFTILLAGDITPTQRLLKQVEGSRVIAADSGIAHAAALALKPELWVGDFDSAGTVLQTAYAHVPKHVFPAAKDATDGEIAITEALKRGAGELLLVGGFGGQFDHVLAHAMFLLALARRGISVSMSSGTEEAHPLLQLLLFVDLVPATRLSVIPLSDIKGLTISGVRFPLKERNVPRGSSLTLSNECLGGRAALGLTSGEALVVLYPK